MLGNAGNLICPDCPSCNVQLGNAFVTWKSKFDGKPWQFPKRPAFCGSCGKPYPWTLAEHQKIEDSGYWSLMHSTVAKLAKPRFEAGHYADAVEATFKELNSNVERAISSGKGTELDGRDLMRKALRCDDPVILLGRPRNRVWSEHSRGLFSHLCGRDAGDSQSECPCKYRD